MPAIYENKPCGIRTTEPGFFMNCRGKRKMENWQHEHQDHVDEAIHDLLCDLAQQELAWDIDFVGAVRDVIGRELAQRGIMSEYDFYPWEVGDEKSEPPALVA